MTNKFSVGIVGGGAVGKAIAAYYGKVKVYDKYKDSDPIEEVAASDLIFVAVPTPHNNGQDLTEMDDAVAKTVSHLVNPDKQIIIIKSTVVPGTTDNYQAKYSQANFIFNPEFLTEKTAIEDFAHPDKQLVGYTTKTKDLADQVLKILPSAPYQKIAPASIAEMAKYAINSYYAFKVIFANNIYDLCEKLEIDYHTVREGLAADSRIRNDNAHFDVLHAGYRGYDGKCLPKDLKSLVWLGQKLGLDLRLLEQVDKINERLKAKK